MTARTPEQDEARRTAEEEPAGSRQVRRRLTFGVAGDLADLPATLSPWQRAYEAWRAAGLRWGHGAPPRDRAEPVAEAPEEPPADPPDVPKPAAPKPAARKPAAPKPASRKPAGGRALPDPHDVLVAGPPKPAADGPGVGAGLRSRVAVAVGLVVVAGGVIVGASRGEESGRASAGVPGAVAADALFAPDPAAATDGLVQELTAVSAAGGTVVAAGTEGDGVPGGERARFLVSSDGGRTWSVAGVAAAGGGALPRGDRPRHVAGTAGDWLALGESSGGAPVAWASDTANTWTRLPLGAPFTPSDTVNALTGTGAGFVAVGTAAGRAAVWTSDDRRTWRRTAGPAGVTSLDRVAARGNVLVVHGTYVKKITARKAGKKVTRKVRADGLWRSADGGRTWTVAPVPQAQGSYGPTKGLAAGPGWFATVREGRQAVGKKKRRRIQRFGVMFTSVDGLKWQAASRFGGYGIERFAGNGGNGGLAVLVQGAKGARTVLRSDDGRTWRPGGTVPAPVQSSALAVAGPGLVVSGRQGNDAYLSGADLRRVPGAVHPERTIRALAAGPGRSVAAGSSNGGAAIWSAPDGRAWTRARFPGTGGWVSDVVHGGKGWLAVGRTSGARPGPLALTSQDGLAWQKSPFPGGPPPVAVTSGPAGYVAVGAGAAWRSSDLRGWRRTALTGSAADVIATAGAYVAVGGRDRAPAVWTSPDGLRWTAAKLPSGLATGPLTEVAAKGRTLVAIGAGAAPLVSVDGGTTWAQRVLGTDVTATAVTATPNGFVVAASTSKGDGAVLTSADGVSWSRLQVPGLSGPGDQRLTALAAMGPAVLGAGTTSGALAESPLLWHAPVPR
ncbi:hypothetical protein E1264_34570 [Actinomadura sp. KC216]|uniref:hypothetical protein n=1 Tax=Actinomadura sp. KC216 TaxID=2530370 RepID=UPI0010459FA0|nr:hypothetical protein [Actinomadura sp. KC216]TDB80108.1 hypothetical protein E1264_34570 [Actinomadura sp. KC216]